MTLIHVDVAELRQKADQLSAAADRLRQLAGQANASGHAAPGYDGQFGPKARAMGDEARSVLTNRADRAEALSADLRARADAFEQADQQFQSALVGMQHRGSYPLTQVSLGESDDDPPWWLIELIIGLFPFGDSIDIIKQIIAWITGGETDELVLLLAIIGLALDLGHLDGPVPDPVDAANAGAALLKGLVKQLPSGPAREAIQATLVRLLKNLDEAPEFLAAIHQVIKRDEVLDLLTENPRALAALLEAGPETIELLAKNEDVALALFRHGDEALPFLKNADALEVMGRYGPEAAQKLIEYGDEGLELIADHGKPMLDFLARTPDELGDLATRTAEALDAAEELADVGLHAPNSSELIETITRNSTQGAGDRVVLGRWVNPENWADEGGGYIGEALENGGIYYNTPPGTYDLLKDTGDVMWQTNEQFLIDQLEAGVARIDFAGDIEHTLRTARGTARWDEINFLLDNAADYGYELVGNSWIRVSP